MDRRLERILTREERIQLDMEAGDLSAKEHISFEEAKRYKEQEIEARKKLEWENKVNRRAGTDKF
jgi:hypothetical protein